MAIPENIVATIPYNRARNGILFNEKFTVDFKEGHVLFETPIYFRDVNQGCLPAPLRLRASFPIRDHVTHAPVCQQFWLSPNQRNKIAIPKVIKQSDIFYEYDINGNDNEQFFVFSALDILNQELYTYKNESGYSAPYKGFVFDIPPDGIVRAVTFDVVEGSGGTTNIDYNMERPEAYFTLQEAHNRRMATYVGIYEAERKRKAARGIK